MSPKMLNPNLTSIYLFKVNNRNARKKPETYSKIKTPRRQLIPFWYIVTFRQVLHQVLPVFLLLISSRSISSKTRYAQKLLCLHKSCHNLLL